MKNYIKKNLFNLMMLVAILFSSIFSITNATPVSATIIGSDKYTNVLQDLKTDDTFNEADYPVDTTDNSLQVITLSESSDKEIFVYVYQPNSPNADLTATSINISTSKSGIKPYNYSLLKINENGVFAKYRVIGLEVSSDSTRYYDVPSIYRKWNEKYDEGSGSENTISEVAFNVAKQYVFQTRANGSVVSDATDIEVITITSKYVGFVRYAGDNVPDWMTGYGFNYANDIDRHFVAFTTDRKIDKLMEADVYYSRQKVRSSSHEDIEVGLVSNLSYTKKSDDMSGDTTLGSLIFGKNTYSWDRIQTIDEFVEENTDLTKVYSNGVFNAESQSNLTEEGKEDLKGKEWVLSFYESEHRKWQECANFGASTCAFKVTLENYDIVSDVTILRLMYETDGVVYNLGVVDNKQTGDLIPDNYVEKSLTMAEWFEILLSLILIILLFVILNPFLPIIFGAIGIVLKVLWKGFKTILKIAWGVISLPFKIIFGNKRK